METVIVKVYRVKAGTFVRPTLKPIGGEHPKPYMRGGHKPRKWTSVATAYGSTNKHAAPGMRQIVFEKPKKV
jgi:hypothetical protein